MDNKKEKFIMYGPHIIQASTVDRVICKPHFDVSSRELSYICTVHTNVGKYQFATFESKAEAMEANKKFMNELNK